MANRIRTHDWSTTPLGPIAEWPQSLKTAVDLMLATAQPVYIGWGPELISLYNDGYISIAGTKHPSCLGAPYRAMWPEIWDEFRPIAADVMAGASRYFVDQPVPLTGRPDRPISWFTFSWTPLRIDDGSVGGFYCVATETTERVLTEQALATDYRRLLDSIDQGYLLADVIFDDAGRAVDIAYVEANPAATRMVGVDLAGKRLREVEPGYEEYWYEIWGRVARSGKGERLERYAAPEGRWYDFHVFKADPGDPASRRVAVLFQDATVRKRAELALRDSEERQAFLLELGDAIRPLADAVEIQTVASRMVAEHLGVARAGYGEVEGEEVVVRADYAVGVPSMAGRYPLAAFGPAIAGIYRDGGIAFIRDTEHEPGLTDDERAMLRAARVAAHATVAIRKIGQPVITFGVHSIAPREWTAAELHLIEDVAERTWAAVVRARTEVIVRQNEERQAFLLDLSDALRPLITPSEIQHAAMKLLAERFDVMRAGYLDVDPDGDMMTMAARFERDAEPVPDRIRLSDYGPDLVAAFRAGHTRYISDTEAEPITEEQRAAHRALGIRAWLIAPLVKAGQLIAIVGVVSRTPRKWTPVQVQLVTDLAERTWDAVQRTRSDAALRESEERLTFLLKLSDALRPLTDAGEIERAATSLLGEYLQADRCFLSPVYDDGSGMCVREEYLRADASSVLRDYTFAQFGDFVGPELHAGHTLAVEDVDALPGLDPAQRASYAATGIGAYLLIPLVRDGRLAAFLTVNHRTPRPWSAADKAIARQTADRLWTARERGRIEQALADSEARYRLLFDTIDEGFCLCERIPGERIDYRYVVVNPAFARQSGLDHPVGRTIREIVPGIEETTMQIYAGVEGTGRAEHFTTYVADLDLWFDVEALPADRPGRIAMLFRNVTDRRRAEAALRESEGRLQLLVAELQHRVRNILTVVRSVFGRTVEAGGEVEAIADHFKGRLDALARTQVVMTQSASGEVDLQNLIREELLSVGVSDGPKVTIDGPDVALPAKTAETIGLAVHELTTNAVKYGALQGKGGALRIEWATNIVEGDGARLVITWTEQGVPAVAVKPTRYGFGSELIEEALPYRLGAETKLEFLGGGVRCTISMPLPVAGA